MENRREKEKEGETRMWGKQKREKRRKREKKENRPGETKGELNLRYPPAELSESSPWRRRASLSIFSF
jgi:hypothetical protein